MRARDALTRPSADRLQPFHLGKKDGARTRFQLLVVHGVADPRRCKLDGSGQGFGVALVGSSSSSLHRLGVSLPSQSNGGTHPVLVTETTFQMFQSLLYNKNHQSKHEEKEPRSA